jgi:hypothetical protein
MPLTFRRCKRCRYWRLLAHGTGVCDNPNSPYQGTVFFGPCDDFEQCEANDDVSALVVAR